MPFDISPFAVMPAAGRVPVKPIKKLNPHKMLHKFIPQDFFNIADQRCTKCGRKRYAKYHE